MNVGDNIMAVDGCNVYDKQTWRGCLAQNLRLPPVSYCASREFVSKERFHSLDPDKCCGDDNNRNLCFQVIGSKHDGRKDLCLPARSLIQNVRTFCNESKGCDAEFLCLSPVLENKFSRLVQIRRSEINTFLFYGFPGELLELVTVVNYKARFWILPNILVHYFETFSR